jgi:hypothetical protein
VNDLVYHNIMTSRLECHLNVSNLSFNEVGLLIQRDLGSNEPIPFDGLEIYEARSPKKRFELWCECGTVAILNWFKDVEGLVSAVEDVPGLDDQKGHSKSQPLGKLVTFQFENNPNSPFLVFWFLNLKTMSDFTLNTKPLEDHLEAILHQKQRTHAEIKGKGTRKIGITAAPVWSGQITRDIRARKVPTRQMGPINFAAIDHFMQSHANDRDVIFNAFLEYFDPVEGYFNTGSIFARDLITYILKRLGKK